MQNMLGPYRLHYVIAIGGMGNVHAASMVGLLKPFAVKEMLPHLNFCDESCKLFDAETKIALQMRHPNIVRTVSSGIDAGRRYIAMERLDGQTLKSLMSSSIRNGALTVPMRLRVVIDLLKGLHAFHEATDASGRPMNLVHRDISPHNVIVTSDGTTKLIDFGLAKEANLDAPQETLVAGKIPYMSPEAGMGYGLDRRADIFSAGVILHELITERRLWGRHQEYEILTSLAAGDIPAMVGEEPEIADICERAMAVHRKDRYATAEEFRVDLEGYLETFGETEAYEVGRVVAGDGEWIREAA